MDEIEKISREYLSSIMGSYVEDFMQYEYFLFACKKEKYNYVFNILKDNDCNPVTVVEDGKKYMKLINGVDMLAAMDLIGAFDKDTFFCTGILRDDN